MKTEVAILGGGNLGACLAQGFKQSSEAIDKYHITVTRRNVELINHLEGENIDVSADNIAAVEGADIVIFAVQPTQIKPLVEEIKPVLDPERHILASTMAGVSSDDIAELTGTEFAILRIMPNTAAAVNRAMTCVEQTQNKKAEAEIIELFETIGRTLVLQSELMEATTVLGACGIAFFLRYIRAASQGGIEVGFHAEEAQLIAAQTALGASALLLDSNNHPEHEIDKVTTPKGCTIAGLNEMEHNGLSSALIKGIKTSFEKIEDIG
ncbi:pyrroline-5-carboxylate reductase [Fodinibius halophilus]|uniref:Pyrroline-5-carboxylate reductase n=1 Tax=Fodinibius halophilus TaxID=1736908 RepID=A0A6M1THS4_9BACT|nr:pyrroline-5-carboxylate reductase [Fodinibius halophilus]NGP88200.1 pyrroline-5-carboxylate reductase [Fodinibius halophilus]